MLSGCKPVYIKSRLETGDLRMYGVPRVLTLGIKAGRSDNTRLLPFFLTSKG